jgi:hypothetical protein
MKTIGVRSCVASFVTAIVLVLQISPARGGDDERGGKRHRRRVEVTYTKWITTFPLMEGFTGGDVPGDFVGEVLQRQVSRDGRIIRLEAVYEVQAGDHSFTALIRGGTGETKSGEPASVSGAALLDGVILAGWRTGAQVHVAFQTMTNCAGAPDARTCFEGTITIEPHDHDDDDD